MNIKENLLKAYENNSGGSFLDVSIPIGRLKRLFAIACCEPIKHLIIYDKQTLEALNIAELYADNLTTDEQLTNARDDLWDLYCSTYDSITYAFYVCTSYAVAYTYVAGFIINDLIETREYQGTILE